MALTPTGVFSRPNFKLRSMLAQCATVQGLLRASSAAAALALILDEAVSGEAARPFIYVTSPEDSPQPLAGGTRTYYKPHGRLSAHIEVPQIWTGAVTQIFNEGEFYDTSLIGHADDFFAGLLTKFTSGALSGDHQTVLTLDGATGLLNHENDFDSAPQVGDEYILEPASEADAHIFFKNLLGAIRSEMLDLSGLGTTDALDPDSKGHLSIQSIRIADWGESLDDKEDERFFGAQIEVEFGI